MPKDNHIYKFIDKKQLQEKPYYVYITTGVNKFLRVYHDIVKEYLTSLKS